MTVRLVDRPKLSSSKIALGHVGVSIADSDFYDVVVFDHALGGAANSSRLAAASRDGSVEEANSAFDKEMERGAYWLTSSVRSRDTLAAVDRLLEEMRKMAKQGPKKTEVTGAIGAIAGGYPMAFQSPDGYARALLDAELQGLGDDYVRDFAVRVGEVTVAKAAAAARARLMPDDVSVVIVGSAAKISPALERRGWKYEVISHLEPISAVERARDADGGEPREVSQADSDAANKILSKALAKKGGARLASLRSFRLRAKATLTLGQQSVPVELARVMVRPDKLQLRMKAMGGTQIITLAGDSGWVAQELGDQRKAQDIGAADLQAAKSQLWRDQELVLLRYKDEDTVAQLVDSSGEHHVIDLRRGRWEVRLFINKKSYLLDKMTYQEGGELSSESYSDYRDVEGVLVAHRRKTTQKMMGQSASFDIALESFELNPTVSPTTFSKGTGSP